MANTSKLISSALNGAGAFQCVWVAFRDLTLLLGSDGITNTIRNLPKALKVYPKLWYTLQLLGPWFVVSLAALPWARNIIHSVSALRALVLPRFRYEMTIAGDSSLYTHVLQQAALLSSPKSSRQITASLSESKDGPAPNQPTYISSDVLESLGLDLPPHVESLPIRQNSEPQLDKHARIEYTPTLGATNYFAYRGKTIYIRHKPGTVDSRTRKTTTPAEVTLTCYGLSSQTLTTFIEEVRQSFLVAQQEMTRIHLTSGHGWSKPTLKPARNMRSVSLDEQLLTQLLDDITRFLTPEEHAWYKDQGIPWRRGYLFWGPPGTGKTSAAIALAGKFNLDVYILNLTEEGLDDYWLAERFSRLPQKCIVLLEDIDCAGIVREDMSKNGSTDKKRRQRRLTLSGLLNCIDGITAPDGRILILTSNKPDSLDGALIRPGRIDQKLLFGHATTEVAKQMFQRLCDHETSAPHGEVIGALADEFAAKIPDRELTPAEISGFLIPRKFDPKSAVAEAEEWAQKTLNVRQRGLEAEVNQAKVASTDSNSKSDRRADHKSHPRKSEHKSEPQSDDKPDQHSATAEKVTEMLVFKRDESEQNSEQIPERELDGKPAQHPEHAAEMTEILILERNKLDSEPDAERLPEPKECDHQAHLVAKDDSDGFQVVSTSDVDAPALAAAVRAAAHDPEMPSILDFLGTLSEAERLVIESQLEEDEDAEITGFL